MDHWESHKVLLDSQHGFRKGRSCETQLAATTEDIAEILDQKGQADCIIMDFSKAFDTVPHQRLLTKLKYNGIAGSLLTWMRHFLTKRTQQVVIDGFSSDRVYVSSGVPQGTVLGPAMFLMYINDLPRNVNSTVRLLADDCIMYKRIMSANDPVTLQEDINTLCTWQHHWLMKFNIRKCFAMHVTHKKNPIRTTYKVGEMALQAVENHTYLGVQLNNKLNWNHHIVKTTAKANSTLGLLRRNLYHCNQSVKSTAYKTLVRPQLEYCATIWDPHHQVYINSLEAVQNRAARFVKRDFSRDSSVSSMVKDLGWKSLEERRLTARLTLLYKASHQLAAINISKYQNTSTTRRMTRQTSALSFNYPKPSKDCYKYSFLPRTVAQWNTLPPTIRNSPTIESFKNHMELSNVSYLTRGALHK